MGEGGRERPLKAARGRGSVGAAKGIEGGSGAQQRKEEGVRLSAATRA
jgi:hypothetical protein